MTQARQGRAGAPPDDEAVTEQCPERPETVIVEREEVTVLYRRTDDNPEAMGRGWAELEAAVGLRGRKFFGTFEPSTGEYRVCVQLRDGDDPEALGLQVGKLAGGRYLRLRLQGQPPGVYELIEPSFQKLLSQADPDPARPSLEYYRRRDVIDLMLPIP